MAFRAHTIITKFTLKLNIELFQSSYSAAVGRSYPWVGSQIIGPQSIMNLSREVKQPNNESDLNKLNEDVLREKYIYTNDSQISQIFIVRTVLAADTVSGGISEMYWRV